MSFSGNLKHIDKQFMRKFRRLFSRDKELIRHKLQSALFV